MKRFKQIVQAFCKCMMGQDLVEYALLLTFLALVAITALPALGHAVSNVFLTAKSTLEQGTTP